MGLGKRLRDFFNHPSAKEVDAFITAAAAGNEKAVGEYCKKYPHHVDAPNKEGQTALQAAVLRKQLTVGNILLEAKADPNKPAKDDISPFFACVMTVARDDDYRFLDMLLKAGANVNTQKMAYNDRPATLHTPLMSAAQGGDKKLCDYLIKHGADPTLKDAGGQTARAYAISAARNHKVDLVYLMRAILRGGYVPLGNNERKKSLRNTATFLKKAQKEWVKRKSSVELKM